MPPAPRAPWTEDPVWPEAQVPFTEKQKGLRDRGHSPDAMRAAAEAAPAPDTPAPPVEADT
jgi:hypothetical protein